MSSSIAPLLVCTGDMTDRVCMCSTITFLCMQNDNVVDAWRCKHQDKRTRPPDHVQEAACNPSSSRSHLRCNGMPDCQHVQTCLRVVAGVSSTQCTCPQCARLTDMALSIKVCSVNANQSLLHGQQLSARPCLQRQLCFHAAASQAERP